jgi:DNA gyrase/topoisomerase IV subunit A
MLYKFFDPFVHFLWLCVWCDIYLFFLRILEAYRTGRGRVVVRGKTDVELLDSKSKRTAIIIKEVVL